MSCANIHPNLTTKKSAPLDNGVDLADAIVSCTKPELNQIAESPGLKLAVALNVKFEQMAVCFSDEVMSGMVTGPVEKYLGSHAQRVDQSSFLLHNDPNQDEATNADQSDQKTNARMRSVF